MHHFIRSRSISGTGKTLPKANHLQSNNYCLLIDAVTDGAPSICYCDKKLAQTVDMQSGVKYDLQALSNDERKELIYYIERYKKYQPWLHTGRSVFLQLADQAAMDQGYVSIDQHSALCCYVQLSLSEYAIAPCLQFFGLAINKKYRVRFHNNAPYEQELRVLPASTMHETFTAKFR